MTPISDITVAPRLQKPAREQGRYMNTALPALRLIVKLVIAFATAAFFLAPWLTEGK
jgi:hypothetical protein